MMNLYRLKNILLFLLINVVLIMGIILIKCTNMTVIDAFPNEGDCVPDQETAIEIAQAVVEEETGKSYSRELFKAVSVYDNAEWEIYTPAKELKKLIINKNSATITTEHIDSATFFSPAKNAEYLYKLLFLGEPWGDSDAH